MEKNVMFQKGKYLCTVALISLHSVDKHPFIVWDSNTKICLKHPGHMLYPLSFSRLLILPNIQCVIYIYFSFHYNPPNVSFLKYKIKAMPSTTHRGKINNMFRFFKIYHHREAFFFPFLVHVAHVDNLIFKLLHWPDLRSCKIQMNMKSRTSFYYFWFYCLHGAWNL